MLYHSVNVRRGSPWTTSLLWTLSACEQLVVLTIRPWPPTISGQTLIPRGLEKRRWPLTYFLASRSLGEITQSKLVSVNLCLDHNTLATFTKRTQTVILPMFPNLSPNHQIWERIWNPNESKFVVLFPWAALQPRSVQKTSVKKTS